MSPTLSNLLVYLAPTATIALAAFLVWCAAKAGQYIKDKRYALSLQVLTAGAASVVADIAQRVVPGLRDPSKPGVWNDETKDFVREQAISSVKKLYPTHVALVRESLQTDEKLHELIGTLVEKGVVSIKIGGAAGAKVSVQATSDGAAATAEVTAVDPAG